MDTKPKGLDSDRTRRIIKLMAGANVWLYRRTGGRLGGTWRVGAGFREPVPICLLEHRGRKRGPTGSSRWSCSSRGDAQVSALSLSP